MGRLAAEQPVGHERHGSQIVPAVAPQVQHDIVGSTRQRECSSVVARASSPKRSSSAAAIGVRKQPVDPPAQIGDQRRGGVPFGRHAGSLAHAPRAFRRGRVTVIDDEKETATTGWTCL
jgi:hypothetical protein